MRISDWSSDVCSSDLVVDRSAGSGPGGLLRGFRADRQGMHRPREFVGEYAVDAPVPFGARKTPESRGYDAHPEMGLAAGPRARMARMHVGIVVHLEYLGRERPLEFASDTLCCRHGRSASTFVLMSCPARIPATGELAFSTPRRTAAGTAARTRGRRAVGLQANCRATILQHVDPIGRATSELQSLMRLSYA